MIVEPGKTYIGKMRATSSERDPLALRIRLSSMFSTLDLHPPGLPKSAIVCIRKVHDPLPGSLRLQRSGIPPPYAWEQAIQASLKQLVEHAVYPARDGVPLHADVVIFADQAEMLACLARDWCAGTITGQWWWQGMFRGKDVGQLLVPTWLHTPEYIPTALQHLATMGRANAFIRALGHNEARAMLRSVIRSFGLYELQLLYEDAVEVPVQQSPLPGTFSYELRSDVHTGHPYMSKSHSAPSVVTNQSTDQARSTSEHLPPPQQAGSPHAPWQPWVQEHITSGLPFDGQCLLGIGLMLAVAPTVVRTPSFARAVLQWRRRESLPSSSATELYNKKTGISATDEPSDIPSVEARFIAPSVPVNSVTNSGDAIDRAPADTTPGSIRISADESESAGSDEPTTSIKPSLETIRLPDPETLSPSPEVTPALAPTLLEAVELALPSEADQSALGTIHRPLHFTKSPTIDQKEPGALDLPGTELETELGGLFYLINLGLFLNLYGDFTTPLQPGISLSIWDFITLLGQQLLGGTMQDDPVWLFLAQLAGRSEQEPAGWDFDPPSSWRLPAEWLEPFSGTGTWSWHVNNGRLQVQHPAQFLVLDLPLDGDDIEAQLKRQMQEFTDARPLGESTTFLHQFIETHCRLALVGAQPPQVERWLRWLMPYVRVRLQRALGLSNADDIPGILCRHAARIILTATHLDIVLSLAALPIEVRLSGIDRDPGWVPAAGRFVAFHFE